MCRPRGFAMTTNRKTTTMDTTVITVEPADYGVGETDRVVFPDSKYVIDNENNLHVHRPEGNVGSFPAGKWRAVIRGDLGNQGGLTHVTPVKA